MDYQLDYTDKRIIDELTKDARISYLELSKKLNVSNSMVHQRIKKIKDAGIISGEGLKISPEKAGYKSCAYTGIVLTEARFCDHVANELEKIPEVAECHYVSGKYALFAKVHAIDNEDMRLVLYDKIHRIEGVSSTDTFMSFQTYFDRELKMIEE